MENLVHIDDLDVKIVDVWPHGLVDIGQLPLVHADDDSESPKYLEMSSSGKAFLIDDENSHKDRAEWLPLSQVTLLRITQRGF